jgi:transcriptional regulator with GAF, ATPase, and Fis domain
MLERVAVSPINVLILGETGVGKEVVAEAIHRLSTRREAGFVRVNCAAVSEALFESELFGHERGAFTGAVASKPGLVEVADKGTVFLDEVGELGAGAQAKLLRVIEAREVTRVGGLRHRSVDVRFLAATNRNLEHEVARGNFRSDLFFRLNGMALSVPPLRARAEEVVPLAELFLTRIAERLCLPTRPRLGASAIKQLLAHSWPGNVRELRNAIERAAVLCVGTVIEAHDLALSAMASAPPSGEKVTTGAMPKPELSPLGPGRLRERERIVEALQQCNGNQTRAAALLGMPRRTLVAKLAALSVPRPRKRD